ncbi:MAG: hypothetical protein ACTFAL_08810 [Candidatus Electronema sp. V4]|uniref:hypothetical protein n=1 Tax=Candidatus Electronema sp. V4 TaxID=3454756 RepID=UPI0040557D84
MRNATLLFCLTVLFSGAMINSTEANASTVNCTPVGVATRTSGRIHIRCAAAVGSIYFFAYDAKKDPNGASRYMSIGTSALISGRNVTIEYDPADLSGASIGCQTNDCRLIIGVEMLGGSVN